MITLATAIFYRGNVETSLDQRPHFEILEVLDLKEYEELEDEAFGFVEVINGKPGEFLDRETAYCLVEKQKVQNAELRFSFAGLLSEDLINSPITALASGA